MAGKRIVVTGLGAITPLGLSVEELWDGLREGRSGVGHITLFDAHDFPVQIAAEVKGFDPRDYMDRKLARRTGRAGQFAIAAAAEAVRSAQLNVPDESERVGVIVATSGGFFDAGEQAIRLRERGPRGIDPLFMTKSSAHMLACQVGRFLGAKGPNSTLNSACASGSDALGRALMHLRLGHADVMLAGGSEALITPLGIALIARLGALSKRNHEPTRASRPFDRERDGFVVGEGAAFLVLETEEHALSRDAPILAELAGAGWSFDAYDDTAPDAAGEALAIKAALRDAGVGVEEVDYINAHGTSTPLNDKTETEAIKRVFGERAYRIPISSTKSMTGHLACAAGALEALVCVLTIQHQLIHPTINYEHPDPECDLDYVPNVARPASMDVCLSDSFGMGGQNACLVFKRWVQYSASAL